MKINELVEQAHENAKAKGWWEEERSFGEQIALMHSELSEALEEYRKNIPELKFKKSPYSIYYSSERYVATGPTEDCKKPEGIPIELADCIIRIFDTCGRYGIDLEEAIGIKMAYNKIRPHKHGGKKI